VGLSVVGAFGDGTFVGLLVLQSSPSLSTSPQSSPSLSIPELSLLLSSPLSACSRGDDGVAVLSAGSRGDDGVRVGSSIGLVVGRRCGLLQSNSAI
jgi:hypothetical protein